MSTATQSDNQAQNVVPDTRGDNQYLTFMLGGEEYGVDILRVQEIKGWEAATPIPNTPKYVKGVMNLRGTIVPIVDLRTRFELDAAAYGPTTVVIVLKVIGDGSERTTGIVVDAVSDVYNVASGELKPPPDFGGAIETDFVKGLATVSTGTGEQEKEKMVILLDIDRLIKVGVLAETEAVVH